ncbi:MAG: hypothetical protein IJ660_01990 [Alphaproteobacteria bacterium]|nr:hypothetical protein [Alphaproteobacteria bacterium]
MKPQQNYLAEFFDSDLEEGARVETPDEAVEFYASSGNYGVFATKVVLELQTDTLSFNIYPNHEPGEEELFSAFDYAIDFIVKLLSIGVPFDFAEICVNSPDCKYIFGHKKDYQQNNSFLDEDDDNEDFIATGPYWEEENDEYEANPNYWRQ